MELVAVYTQTLHWISNHFQSGLALFSISILMISLYMYSLIPRPSGESSPNEGEGLANLGRMCTMIELVECCYSTGVCMSWNGCDVACTARAFHGSKLTIPSLLGNVVIKDSYSTLTVCHEFTSTMNVFAYYDKLQEI